MLFWTVIFSGSLKMVSFRLPTESHGKLHVLIMGQCYDGEDSLMQNPNHQYLPGVRKNLRGTLYSYSSRVNCRNCCFTLSYRLNDWELRRWKWTHLCSVINAYFFRDIKPNYVLILWISAFFDSFRKIKIFQNSKLYCIHQLLPSL